MRLLASGRTADVYDIGAGQVLRRYREGWPAEHEAEVMTYLAACGYPVPAVISANGPDIVMEHVTGPTMVGALAAGQLSLDECQRLLAGLHTHLHALPPRIGAAPDDRVLHLDLHPENVLMSATGPVVIDWANAIEGPAGFDVAVTALIYAEVAVDPEHSLADIARAALTSFLGYASVPSDAMVTRALAFRTANPTLSDAEKSRLASAAALIAAA